MMYELPLVVMAGLLGSSHCLGMCGPFALAIGAGAPSWRTNLARQIAYACGRLFTYSVMGGVVGFGGMRLAEQIPAVIPLPSMMSIIAGGFLVWQGLVGAQVVSRWGMWSLGASWGTGSSCLSGGLLRSFLRSRSYLDLFLAGLVTGFLPCGLVYGFLALAAAERDLFRGTVLMGAMGMGTVPAMVVAGMSGSLLSLSSRARIYRIAGWSVVLAGGISIVRGISFLQVDSTLSGCPMCH